MKNLKKIIKLSTCVIGLGATIAGFEALATDSEQNRTVIESQAKETDANPLDDQYTFIDMDNSIDYVGYYDRFSGCKQVDEALARRQAEVYEEQLTAGRTMEYADYYAQSMVLMGMKKEQAEEQASKFVEKLKEIKDAELASTYAQVSYLNPGMADDEVDKVVKEYKRSAVNDSIKKDKEIGKIVEKIKADKKQKKKDEEKERILDKLEQEGLIIKNKENTIGLYNQYFNSYKNERLAKAALRFIKDGGSDKLVKFYLSAYSELVKDVNENNEKEIEAKATFIAHGWKKEEISNDLVQSYIKSRAAGNGIEIAYASALFDGEEKDLEKYIEAYVQYMKKNNDDSIGARLHAICVVRGQNSGFENKFINEYKEIVSKSASRKEAEKRAYWVAASGRNRDDYDKYNAAYRYYREEVKGSEIEAKKYAELIVSGKDEKSSKEFAKAYVKGIGEGLSESEAEARALATVMCGEENLEVFSKEYSSLVSEFGKDKAILGASWVSSGNNRELVREYLSLYSRFLSEDKDEKKAKLKADYIANGNDKELVDEYVTKYLENESNAIYARGYALCSLRYPGLDGKGFYEKFAHVYEECIKSGASTSFAEMYAECTLDKNSKKTVEELREIAAIYEKRKLEDNRYITAKAYTLARANGKDDTRAKEYVKFYAELLKYQGFSHKKGDVYAKLRLNKKSEDDAKRYADIYCRNKFNANLTSFIMRGGDASTGKIYLPAFEDGLKLFKGNAIEADMFAMLIAKGRDKKYATKFAKAFAEKLEELTAKGVKDAHISACAYAEYIASGNNPAKVDTYVRIYITTYNRLKSCDRASVEAMNKAVGKKVSIASGVDPKNCLYRDWVF